MARAISVVLAVLALLAVGWYFGQRPLAGLQAQFTREKTAWHDREAELVQRAEVALAREQLWAAQAGLLHAALEVEAKNFGIAGSSARRAQDLIVRVAGVPGVTFELGPLRNRVEAATVQVDALNPRSADLLRRAAEELRTLLEQSGRA